MVAKSGSGWYLAKSLVTLFDQIDKAYPNRDISSDGTIGNEAHQATNSDHNPHSGVVYALDITHDPLHGVDTYKMFDQFREAKDERIEYIISNRKIMSGTGQDHEAWLPRPYNGTNPHDMHIHVNVKDVPLGDKTQAWEMGAVPVPVPSITNPTIARGSRGKDVELVQRLLLLDGIFGPATEAAVKKFQKENGLTSDGVVGPYTWRGLLKEPTKPVEGEWFDGITATVFGGTSENEPSAYDGHRITQTELAVALPNRFGGKRPRVEVRKGDKSVVATIEDVGPWYTDDPYWETKARPLAETGLIIRGPNKGRTPNKAGIDLSPAVAKALGIDGIGKVDWRFVV